MVISFDDILSFHNSDKLLIFQHSDFSHIFPAENFHGLLKIVGKVKLNTGNSQVLANDERSKLLFLWNEFFQLIQGEAAHVIVVRVCNLEGMIFAANSLINNFLDVVCIHEDMIVLTNKVFRGKRP